LSQKLITPLAILSYPHLAQPQKPNKEGEQGKYSCTLIFTPELLADPKEKALYEKLQLAALDAAKEKFGSNAEKLLKSETFRKPFRSDAEAKGYPAGSKFINIRSAQQPGIVYPYAGPDGKPLRMPLDKIKDEMYAGVIVRASVSPFGYDNSGNKGVSFGLNNLQKIRDGERIDGRTAPENEFEVDLNAQPADLSDLGL
jgi:hypothetical protein